VRSEEGAKNNNNQVRKSQMQLDYLKLSELYASFLAALGGVSITILTLVLTLYPKRVVGNLSRFWVAALFVATISCFTGAHLMAETVAFISGSNNLLIGTHLSLLASVNIYVAAMLLIYAVVLLTAEYVRWISALAFLFVFLITLSWMYVTATTRFDPPDDLHAKGAAGWAIAIGGIIAIVMCAWALSRLSENWFLFASFLLPVCSAAFSFFYFVRIFRSQDRELSVWLYSFAIALPCMSLFGAGMGLVLRKKVPVAFSSCLW
jgi:hypothetical protein